MIAHVSFRCHQVVLETVRTKMHTFYELHQTFHETKLYTARMSLKEQSGAMKEM